MSGPPLKTPPKATENKPFEKIRTFFGRSGKSSSSGHASHLKTQPPQEFLFTKDHEKELSPDTALPHRLRFMKELAETVEKRGLEPNALERIWLSMKDLTHPRNGKDERQAALYFLGCLIQGQYGQLGIMRDVFFKFVESHRVSEDLTFRLKIFKVLSRDGKDLKYFEREAGPFLLEWLQEIMSMPMYHEFLALLVNVLKFNSSFIDEEVMDGYVHLVCHGLEHTSCEPDIELSLRVLDSVVCYSYLPRSSLTIFVASLCQLLSVQRFSYTVWTLMRKLLGTHIGHSAVYTMCSLLQTKQQPSNDKLAITMKGAISALGMALWGNKRVTGLKVPPLAILPSFLQALPNSGHSVPVANEMMIVMQQLITKLGKDLDVCTWDLILTITETLLNQVESTPNPTPALLASMHDLLTCIEGIHAEGQLLGSPDRLFAIIDRCTKKRPESSTLALLTHKAELCKPSHTNWRNNLCELLEKFYGQEVRTSIRLKALDVLSAALLTSSESSLLELALLPSFATLDKEKDPLVVRKGMEILMKQALTCQTHRCSDIIQILKRILYQPSLVSPTKDEKNRSGTVGERKEAADALVKLFKVKLFQVPSSHCLEIYEILVLHLMNCYLPHQMTQVTQYAPIRKVILECLLSLRCDSQLRIGIKEGHKTKYTPFMQISDSVEGFGTSILSATSSTTIPTASATIKPSLLVYAQAFKCICLCLDKERDWPVLSLALESLPSLLQNKTLMFSAVVTDLAGLCSRLCAMVSDRQMTLQDKFTNTPEKFTKSQFHSEIFPVLACFLSYHKMLLKGPQRELVKCLEFGLVSRASARMCVRALTVGALEMHDTMMRLLPAVLLKLSQISATAPMAIPLMEFLSSLLHLPQLYSNFVEEQYMSVFAIALPYTNPFKYNHYTVSLAYHVIAMWFLKCRLSFRKDFVMFIVKGFKANVLSQLDECRKNVARLNQDSADRFRTQSLDESARRKSMAAAQTARNRMTNPLGGGISGLDDSTSTFHKELTETCIDMMARYTYSTFTNLPRRSKVSEFLLNGGQQSRWLLGSKIITITTSGGAKMEKAGLCEKCLKQARNITANRQQQQQQQAATDTTQAAEQTQSGEERLSTELRDRSVSDQSLVASSGRRRHKSAAVPSQTRSVPLTHISQDDMLINRSPAEGCLERRMSMGSQGSSLADEDIHLPSPAPPTASAPAASTASLETRSGKIHALDSVLIGLKPAPQDKSIFSPHLCNCWCTQWAEIHIRTPTGNLSWMMRIQNDQDLAASFPDFPLDDISHLFTAGGTEVDTLMDGKKIDSNSLGDDEYDSLHQEHFESQQQRAVSDAFTKAMLENDTPKGKKLEGDKAESDDETSLEEDVATQRTRIRKTLSSPDLQSPTNAGSFAPIQLPDEAALDSSKSISEQSLTGHDSTENLLGAKGNESPTKVSSSVDLRRPRGKTITSIPEENIHKGSPPHHSSSMTNLPLSNPPSDHARQTRFARGTKFHDETSPGSRFAPQASSSSSPKRPEQSTHGGVNPSFLFLQLYHQHTFGKDRPLHLPMNNDMITRAVNMFDLIFPYETHKIGVIYAGPGQTDQTPILANTYGSVRYTHFVSGLGHLLRLCDVERDGDVYVGGLDTSQQADDGQFAYAWHDEFMQVIFHVATLMPTGEKDPQCNAKKRHIGNDYVCIVYNNSGENYKLGTIKGQFNYVNITIEPLDNCSNTVTVQTRAEIEDMIGHTDTKIVSDKHLPVLVRQMAVHADLASTIVQKQKSNPNDLYASNWLERWRAIKRLRAKVEDLANSQQAASSGGGSSSYAYADDFTEYT